MLNKTISFDEGRNKAKKHDNFPDEFYTAWNLSIQYEPYRVLCDKFFGEFAIRRTVFDHAKLREKLIKRKISAYKFQRKMELMGK